MVLITGKYVLAPNPCTTLPCLPGMVYAILAEKKYYYVTVNQSLIWAEGKQKTWNGYTPKDGDSVTVDGEIHEKLDVKGESFYQIEVEQLIRAR
jgi:hypothetical protein